MHEDDIQKLDACMAKLIKRHEPPAETAVRVRSRIQHAQNAGWIWPGNGFDTYRLVAEIYRKAFAVYKNPGIDWTKTA